MASSAEQRIEAYYKHLFPQLFECQKDRNEIFGYEVKGEDDGRFEELIRFGWESQPKVGWGC